MADVLIIRLSAMGDVAMTVPIIESVAKQYPSDTFTVLSQGHLQPLFAEMPENVRFINADVKGKHKGFRGLFRLYKELKAERHYTKVADLHNVLRSRFLRFLFNLSGAKVAKIHKGRKEKKALTRRKNKLLIPLKSSFQRYCEVFEHLKMPVHINFVSIFGIEKGDLNEIIAQTGAKQGNWIGIAPFAKHKGKIYPLEFTEEIVEYFSQEPDTTLFLFGGGADEKAILSEWAAKYPNVKLLSLNLHGELILMSYLDVMLSMDSANMHLASLTGTPVVSIWGATHPYAGFFGFNQNPIHAVQFDITCRPCSVYGNKPCFRHDYACLYEIKPTIVIETIEAVLLKQEATA